MGPGDPPVGPGEGPEPGGADAREGRSSSLS